MSNADLITVATFAFVLVTLIVGGLRALRTLERRKAEQEAERLGRISRRARPGYTGPRYNEHGREIG